MDTKPNFDRLRAWTEGTMSAEERARFEREMTLDPALSQSARDFRAVWAATAIGLGATPSSRTSFDVLARRMESAEFPREGRWRRVAAALLIVAPIAGIAWYWIATRASGDALPAPPSPIARPLEPAPEIPSILADYSPVREGVIRWLTSVEEARAVSAVVGRPIFVFGFVQNCPICIALRQNELQDPAVLTQIERSVPLAIDLMALDDATRQTLWSRRYPLLELQDERGTIIRTFAGEWAEVDMIEELRQGLQSVQAPSWKLVNELTTTLERAKEAEKSGNVAEASREYAEVARQHDAPVLARAGEVALARLENARTH